jgi:hypothetical protein
MSGFLIDTNVLSEYNRLGGPMPPSRNGLRLRIANQEAWFSGRILGVDRQVARCWATLVAQRGRAGRPLDFESVGAIVINQWKAA